MARTSLAGVVLAVVLVVSNIAAHAAVLGIDFGTEYIKAALVKPGIPLEIVLTKDSRRKEISAVTFKPERGAPQSDTYPERLYGSDAMALAPRFPADNYPNLKSILGLPADHAAVTVYSNRHPALQIQPTEPRGTVAFKSKAFSADTDAWSVEELIAMQLQSIQKNAEALAGAGSTVKSVVLIVPPFYTQREKRAIQTAADLAGLKVLSLISDGLAVGLNYATSRTFPNVADANSKPETHMVFDMGAGSTKASILRFQSRTVKDVGKFNKTIQEVHVLGNGWDRSLGGDELNGLIIDDMLRQFVDTPAANTAGVAIESVQAHGRAIAKLSKDAERVRHVLSANQKTGASFESLYNDVDFKYSISRADFEEMAQPHAERVHQVVKTALENAGLEVSDIDSIILHGGVSRTPFIQRQLEKFVGDAEKIRTSVNSDEAALFGAGFRAAELSPSFRVKEIRIADAAGYPTGIDWVDANGKERHQRLWKPTSPLGGSGKEVTFSNREDFTVNFNQDTSSGTVDTNILTTKNLTASVTQLKEKHGCTDESIQLKVGMRLAPGNGEIGITSMLVECEADEPEKETFVDGVKNLFGFGKKDSKDQQVLQDGEEPSAPTEDAGSESSASAYRETEKTTQSGSAISASTDASKSADAEPAEKPKVIITINIDYLLSEAGTPSLTKTEVATLKDRLKAFASSDRQRKLREEALNNLEGYTYKVRDFLEAEAFAAASTEQEQERLVQKSSETSDWIYDDGADAPTDELVKRLKTLEEIVNPIKIRVQESEERPKVIEDLRSALAQSKEFVSGMLKNIAEYAEWEAKLASSPETKEAEKGTEDGPEGKEDGEKEKETGPEPGSGSSTSPPPESEESGDFAGLEDEETPTAGGTVSMAEEHLSKDLGPIPPMYTAEDLEPLEKLGEEISLWLDEEAAKQKELGPTDNPILLVKDIKARREKLDKAGMDVALKGVKNQKKREKESASSKSKSSKNTKTSAQHETKTKMEGEDPTIKMEDFLKDESFIKLGEDGKMPSEEELQEMIRKINEMKDGKNTKDGEHDEL